MIAPMFDRCMICGMPIRKQGGGLCTRHEFEALISLGYERMIERLRGNIPASGRRLQPMSRQNISDGKPCNQ